MERASGRLRACPRAIGVGVPDVHRGSGETVDARLRLVERRFEGFFQAKRYVVGERPLREIAPRAVIAWPRDDDQLPARPFVVRGYAWDGRGSLARVDVSADGGRSWRDATLDDALSPYAWRQWHASVAPGTSGQLVVMARAVTTDGDEQPLAEVRNELGYANNAVRPVRLEIHMNNSAGIYQVDGLLKAKLQGSGLEPYVEVVAHIDTEAEKKLVPIYRLET